MSSSPPKKEGIALSVPEFRVVRDGRVNSNPNDYDYGFEELYLVLHFGGRDHITEFWERIDYEIYQRFFSIPNGMGMDYLNSAPVQIPTFHEDRYTFEWELKIDFEIENYRKN